MEYFADMDRGKFKNFNGKKISRKQILAVSGIVVVIVLLHVLLLSSCRDSGEDQKKDVPASQSGEVVSTPAPPPRPLPPPPPPSKIAAPVAPWYYNHQLRLPPALENRFRQGKGRSGIIIDLNSRRVLWSKDPQKRVPVASLTKLMTALMVMEKLETDRDFKWTTMLTAYPNALKVKNHSSVRIPVGGLMQAMLISSNNGAAVVLAEAFANRDIHRFVARMNSRAHNLGLRSANFNSPNGLPQGKRRINSYASVADICHICELLMVHERVMTICSSKTQSVRYIGRVESTNRLLHPKKGLLPVEGVFGFKTGYTRAAGFCLAFGVKRGDRIIIGCVTGFKSSPERDIFCREIVQWAFRQQ